MGAIVHVSAINRMVIRGLNIILLMSTGVIAAEVFKFLRNNDLGNILFRDHITDMQSTHNTDTFSLFNYLITVTTNVTNKDNSRLFGW
jgi:hypothetical protein